MFVGCHPVYRLTPHAVDMSIMESVLPVMSDCSMCEVYLTCTLSTNTVDGLRERRTADLEMVIRGKNETDQGIE